MKSVVRSVTDLCSPLFVSGHEGCFSISNLGVLKSLAWCMEGLLIDYVTCGHPGAERLKVGGAVQ